MKQDIIELCNRLQSKLGKDNNLFEFLSVLFDHSPDDTWLNVKEAYEYMKAQMDNKVPPMTVDEFAHEMTVLGFDPHVRGNNSGQKLFTLVIEPINIHVYVDDNQILCHSQTFVSLASSSLFITNFTKKFSQNLASSPYPYDGMLSLMALAVEESKIFSEIFAVLDT